MRKNYYQVLGVRQNAKQSDIDAAYVELKEKFQGLYDQGDQSASEELFNLRAAYETLSIPEKRGAYDEKLAAMQFQPQPTQKHTPQPKSPQDHNKAPKLIECSVCGKQMSSGAATCPHCGEKNPNAKAQGSILGITSVGLGIGSVLMPYFAAVFLVPATIICGVIAIKNDQKRLGIIAVVLGFIGLAGIIYTSSQITKFELPPKFRLPGEQVG